MLAELSEEELTARIGQAGRILRQLARGEFPHPFEPNEPAFMLEERMELGFPVELLDAVLFVGNAMPDQRAPEGIGIEWTAQKNMHSMSSRLSIVLAI